MKKIYEMPIAEILTVEITSIMNASLTNTSGAEGLGKGNDWTNGAANSRDADYWDE